MSKGQKIMLRKNKKKIRIFCVLLDFVIVAFCALNILVFNGSIFVNISIAGAFIKVILIINVIWAVLDAYYWVEDKHKK